MSVVKNGSGVGAADAPVEESDASTRVRVVRSILRHGPSTANALAERLQLTPAAIRRHLTVLVGSGQLSSRQQRVYGQRGRGRPSKVFELTDAGRSQFFQAYDELAVQLLGYLSRVAGPQAVKDFAAQRTAEVESQFGAIRPACQSPAEALVEALTREGFVASLLPVASGEQLCQYHCPVAHVAAEFPQLCEVETEVFSRLLGSHVQRLATIAHGDGVCTLHIPRPVEKGN
ncbi:MAG: transcriptional regulator [Propionibacteriaceae bacterium]|jgi:predicted ArsR family transcriptional regulator|nr:transcriptional regulator [Propionibacteriaceae bacterium]